MIVDIHTHSFPDKIARGAVDHLSKEAHIVPHTGGTNEELLSSMDRAGIDLSVVMPVATNPEQVVKVNDSSLRNNEKYYYERHDRRIMSFGCMHPLFADYRSELKRLSERGIKGIKIHPVYQETDIDDVSFLRIIECAAENDLIVLTHAGLDIGFPGVVHCSPKMCQNVIKQIGDFKFVLAHMGGWRNWEEVPELLAGSCAYIDTSFSSEEIEPLSDGYWDDKDIKMLDASGYEKIIRAFGTDKVMYGSDSPWTEQKDSLEFVKNLQFSDEEKNAILGGNAAGLLGI